MFVCPPSFTHVFFKPFGGSIPNFLEKKFNDSVGTFSIWKKRLKNWSLFGSFFFAGRFGPMNLFAAWKVPCLFHFTRYSPTWKGTPTYIPHHPASSVNRESFLTALLVMFWPLTYQIWGGMFLVSGHFLWACFTTHLSGTCSGVDQFEVYTNELCNLYG